MFSMKPMTPDEILQSCRDPQIRVIKAQAFALRLLARGLRPKQVAIATGISQWKVNDLRKGLMPSDCFARPPMSVATILRRPWLRAGASLFVGVHQRIADGETDTDDPWSLFLESYDIYALLAGRFRDVWPLLAIEDACTIFLALESGLVASAACDRHGTRYLVVPGHDRAWGCPYCTLEAGEWSLPSDADAEICARTVQQSLDRAGARVCDHPRYTGPIEVEDQP